MFPVPKVVENPLLEEETFHVNDPVTDPPRPSLAVIWVVNAPTFKDDWLMVPDMVPMVLICIPSGNPTAVKVSGSRSGSENDWATEKDTLLPVLSNLLISEEKVGCRLATRMVQGKELEVVPPRPSLAVIMTLYGVDVFAADNIVPVMIPLEDMDKNGGRFEAENVNVSLSGSEK